MKEVDVLYKAVIFDLDGTLLDSLGEIAAAGNHTLTELGFATHPECDYKRMIGNGIPILIQRFLPPEHQSDTIQAHALRLFLSYYDAPQNLISTPYPGILTTLDALHNTGIKLGVVSNKEDSLVKATVYRCFPGIFDKISGHILGTPPKPNPHLLHEMRLSFGFSCKDVLYVGDTPVDIQTAHNAGLDGCGVVWGFRSEKELLAAGAEYIVRTPNDLFTVALKKTQK